ncbi:MAG: cupredoxin domain-containing protein [Actinomycetota bacterium]
MFAASIILAACGSDGGGNGTTAATGTTSETGSTGGGTTITIESTASGFDPDTITVSGPTEVTVTNNDSVTHTFTLDDNSASELLTGGETVTVAVDVSETTGFHCNLHPQMTGTIEVA